LIFIFYSFKIYYDNRNLDLFKNTFDFKMSLSKPMCPICLNEPFLPVSWNNIKEKMVRGQPIYLEKCPAANKNPICLTCVRDYLNSQEGDRAQCPSRCCYGYKGLDLYQTYGFVLRTKKEYAEDCMWTLLDSYGVLNKQCNRCEHICETLEETLNHLRKDCLKRKIPCGGCKGLVPFNEIDVHKLSCEFARFKIL